MNINTLENKIEAYLFFKGEPVNLKDLTKILNTDINDINIAIENIQQKQIKNNSGIIIIRLDDEITLGTSPISSDFIFELTKEELQKDLGKSALETLAIVLYKGPIKRSEIDYIRGVNSQFILRNLTMRGLIDRVIDTNDERTFYYKASLELISHIGLLNKNDLPEYENILNKLNELEKTE